MCTRYYMESSPELRPIIEAARRSPLSGRMISQLARPLKTEGEIRPTDIAPVIAPNPKGTQSVYPMIWGFTLPKSKTPLVNARVESAADKPTFKESWDHRRCIIPASWYYEWQHFTSPDGKVKTGDKFTIQPEGSTLTLLAGLYRIEDGFPHFTVLTKEPSAEIRFIHDRMPVILPPSLVGEWISPGTEHDRVHEIVACALDKMVFEKSRASI